MKRSIAVVIALGISIASFGGTGARLHATESAPRFQYANIYWDGRDRTIIVWPDGRVEFQEGALASIVVPQHADERAVLMTALINKLVAQGYEFAGLASGEQVLMRRAVR